MPPPEATGSAPDQSLGRRRRLRRSRDFQEAYAQGRRWIGRYLVLWLRTGPEAALRLGVVASRKVGGAVARNRARRRLRELFRRRRWRWRGECDVVLVARKGLAEAPWPELEKEIERLAHAAGLVNDP